MVRPGNPRSNLFQDTEENQMTTGNVFGISLQEYFLYSYLNQGVPPGSVFKIDDILENFQIGGPAHWVGNFQSIIPLYCNFMVHFSGGFFWGDLWKRGGG